MERIDALCGKGERSAWVERWLRLGAAVQEEDEERVDEWVEWAKKMLDCDGVSKMAIAMDCIAHGLDRWVDGP